MNDTIDWLIKMESTAKDFYTKASKAFSDDHGFSEFLSNLAHDESMHLDEILRIGELERRHIISSSLISVNDDIKFKHLNPLLDAETKLDAGQIDKNAILELIVTIEFSEWNDVFIYIMNEAKAKMRSFIPSAVNLQNHKNYISRYVEKQVDNAALKSKLSDAPKFWEEKILVVDDFFHIRQLLKSVLSGQGIIETAGNGEEALKKLDDTYYAVVVSDNNMEGMNGTELFKNAIEKYPRLKNRFMFLTSSNDEELIRFFKDNNLPYLIKPAGIIEIRNAVADIISKRR